MEERQDFHITVSLILLKNNKVLLIKRKNTGYMDGMYALIGGHVEKNESFKEAMMREAKEEAGIDLNTEDLDYVCAIHTGKNSQYLNLFFKAQDYEGEIINTEPDKCEEISWIDIDNLPENVIENDKRAIYNLNNDISFEEYDF